MTIRDADDTLYVYDWRLEQESAMRKAKGTGMSDEQVVNFVNGCEYFTNMSMIAKTDFEIQITQRMNCTPMYYETASLERRKGSS